MKKLCILLSCTLLAACQTTSEQRVSADTATENTPKNIIMIVADGMGPAYTTAYRYFADDPSTLNIEQTVFDRHLVGAASTYPAHVSGYVTDSAAAASALASGVKTYNGAISVDVNKKPVETVLERAKSLDKKTGVVVTSQINHATPAAYLSHNVSRRNYNEIADSYFDNGIKADVYLGGGWQYFIRENRNLVKEFQQQGFYYLDNYQQLSSLPANQPIIGLFADKGLPWAIDDSDKNRLSTMTKAAIKQLENEQGYFMLIEASQVDWAGHSNDINSAMAEVADLAATIEYLESYVKQSPDTLVVLTADHSTGGLTIGANGLYEWRPQLLREMTQSTQTIAEYFSMNQITAESLSKHMANISISAQEADKIVAAKKNAQEKLNAYLSMSKEQQQSQAKPIVEKAIYQALNKLIDAKTNTGWTGGGHTAVDVPVYSFGAGHQQFSGKIDNTDIAKTMFKFLAHKR
ncbi:alkaline phosphatase [Thalassotalea sp. G2M2-11]|uniref:alkaline phosphatase n=1 Tax=Thalassotalea sp. G2M2-11 TaxID=2787627 RepID=UPI0019D24755|nr:alkaline phosphatase [Thalassotalea sp. G2M2-11]